MNYTIAHEAKERLRLHLKQRKMTFHQADILQYYMQQIEGVTGVVVHELTSSLIVHYKGERKRILRALEEFSYERAECPKEVLENSRRQEEAIEREKQVEKVLFGIAKAVLMPKKVPKSAVKFAGKVIKNLV